MPVRFALVPRMHTSQLLNEAMFRRLGFWTIVLRLGENQKTVVSWRRPL
jgi:hypothetical protein